MPFQAIEPQRIYQRIADQIGDLIRNGEFRMGQKLPPERELAKTFEVSRNVVREAMVALEIAGLIDVRIGAGTFVAAAPTVPVARPSDLAHARHLIEGEIAARAAECRADGDVEAIREALERIQREPFPNRSALQWNRRFHLRVADATRNGALVEIMRSLWRPDSDPVLAAIRNLTAPASPQIDVQALRRVFHAIAVGDPANARTAMQAHLWDAASMLIKADAVAIRSPGSRPSGPKASSRTPRGEP